MDASIRERPARLCDVVMKGGITSGVVYPRAVCEIAATYRLKSVGGTSAGAIAAAAAAAAEYGRAGGGFDVLDELPNWIGAKGNLIGLFQPQRKTRQLYAAMIAGVAHKRARWLWVPLAAIRGFPLIALAGSLPGVALGYLLVRDASGTAEAAGYFSGALLAVLGMLVAIALRVYLAAKKALPGNFFGLCSGMEGDGSARPALTPWLAGVIAAAAGRQEGDPPLTFGELWDGPPGVNKAPGDEPWLRLEMVTTNVTNHRAERLPSASGEYYFSPDEFRRLFPQDVVEWMIVHPPGLPAARAARQEAELHRRQMLPLRPMPEARELPVIVATRMSLSFPVLLSAIPLWKVDFSRKANQHARTGWREWLQDHRDEWDEIASDEVRWEAVKGERPHPRPERCWFSDGGIASNFPVHFFDSHLPRHPTFAINLRPFHPDRAPAKGQPPSPDQDEHVWLPERHNAGILDWWYRFDGSTAGFLSNIVRTMQNRIDDAQIRMPGHRERVVHVSLTKEEGGMNLDMEKKVVDALTERGRSAAKRLVQRFAHPPADPKDLSWEDHRWVRLRTTFAATGQLVHDLGTAYTETGAAGERTYAELLARERGSHPLSYPMTDEQRAVAQRLADALVTLDADLGLSETPLSREAPRPAQSLRLTET